MQAAGTLSGGEQQMLAISRALMSRPKLVLFDEPSLGLAPNLVERTFEIIKDIRAQGVTVVMVEQNAFAALELSDRSYVLEQGRVTLSGTGAELLAQPPRQERVFGGVGRNSEAYCADSARHRPRNASNWARPREEKWTARLAESRLAHLRSKKRVEQRRAEAAAEVMAPLAPVEARPAERAAATTKAVEGDAEVGEESAP